MRLDRRRFLLAASTGVASLALPWGSALRAQALPGNTVFVVLFLRGGMDALHLVVPHGDAAYASQRPTLAIPPATLLPLDAFFGMNPDLTDLHALYAAGDLAIVHAAGNPNPTRSHFDAQDDLEKAAPAARTVQDGWLNRVLAELAAGTALGGVSVGYAKDLSLEGPAQSLQLDSVTDFALRGSFPAERRATLEALHAGPPSELLPARAAEAFGVLDDLAKVTLSPSSNYPNGSLADHLREIAGLIRADIGVRVATTNLGGWDTHEDQMARLPGRLQNLGASLAAFQADLGADASRVVTLVCSEFGRTSAENGTFGADHGRGTAMFLVGPGVDGGRVVLKDGTWPGLDPTPDERDLVPTTDFRDVYAEVLTRHLGLADASPVFPDFVPDPANRPGLLL
jgi:uncharacterized protein (DUF1501 family)